MKNKEVKILIDTKTNKLYASTPYNKDFIDGARRLQGFWLQDSLMWSFKPREGLFDDLANLCRRAYGVFPASAIPFDAPKEALEGTTAGGIISVEIEKKAPKVERDWKSLDDNGLLDLYLAIEQELRRRGV